jgi:hypothetical protein
MIDQECRAMRGDPEREAQAWLGKLNEMDRKRSRYQEMAAEGLIDFDELRSKLDALETDRKTATRELEALSARAERLASLKLETEALIEAYSSKARAGLDLDLYTPQDRFDAYKALGLKVTAHPDGTTELSGGPLHSNSKSRRLSP